MDIKVDEQTALVFDLDDTLYNELDYLKSAFKSIAEQIDPEHWKSIYVNMLGRYRCGENAFDYLVAEHKSNLNHLLEQYRHHSPDITPFDGVVDIFSQIKRYNGSIGIITDGRSLTQRAKIQALGVGNYIDQIVISEEVGSEKPELRNFEIMEERLGVKELYYFGDNLKKDFIAPRALGWQTVGLIDNGMNIHFNGYKFMAKKYRPQYFIASFREIEIKG